MQEQKYYGAEPQATAVECIDEWIKQILKKRILREEIFIFTKVGFMKMLLKLFAKTQMVIDADIYATEQIGTIPGRYIAVLQILHRGDN